MNSSFKNLVMFVIAFLAITAVAFNAMSTPVSAMPSAANVTIFTSDYWQTPMDTFQTNANGHGYFSVSYNRHDSREYPSYGLFWKVKTTNGGDVTKIHFHEIVDFARRCTFCGSDVEFYGIPSYRVMVIGQSNFENTAFYESSQRLFSAWIDFSDLGPDCVTFTPTWETYETFIDPRYAPKEQPDLNEFQFEVNGGSCQDLPTPTPTATNTPIPPTAVPTDTPTPTPPPTNTPAPGACSASFTPSSISVDHGNNVPVTFTSDCPEKAFTFREVIYPSSATALGWYFPNGGVSIRYDSDLGEYVVDVQGDRVDLYLSANSNKCIEVTPHNIDTGDSVYGLTFVRGGTPCEDPTPTPTPTNTPAPSCPDGQIWSDFHGKCVDATFLPMIVNNK